MENDKSLIEIFSALKTVIAQGFTADTDIINFIQSSFGLSDTDDICSLIENGDDGGTVADLISYPHDSFRELIEKMIPPDGFSLSQIQIIENLLLNYSEESFININGKKVILSKEDSLFCCKKFLKRLNLQISLNSISLYESAEDSISILRVKANLRKKKFITTDENVLFINDMIYNYNLLKNKSNSEFLSLVNLAIEFLNGTNEKPFDILSERKYYYENAVMEAEEFSQLMKTYSMEFIMMKRIQPPLISIDEARSMIKQIDRLTSIVYRMIIPSVNNVIMDSY